MAMSTAQRLAKSIINGFDAFFGDFQNVTLGAQACFEKADWQAVHCAMANRLKLYKKKVYDVADVARVIAGDSLDDRILWRQAKAEYAVYVASHQNFEIAQTFFNSVYCFVFGHEKIRDVHAFVIAPERPAMETGWETIIREYSVEAEYPIYIRRILEDAALTIPFEDIERDVRRIAKAIAGMLQPYIDEGKTLRAQVLDSLFYRNKAAYLVGRILVGEESLPFVLPILNNENAQAYVDTVLYDPDDVSILFSFTRSYFMVDASIPSQYVSFLKSIMPQKEIFELYNTLGFGKHGKTEFYRRAVWHTLHSEDQYVIAPGIKGMVMLVFTRPDFDYVYKVIKERFTPPKDMSRAEVKEKYKLVKRWDRAGRLADTQEFSNLAFDRRRFSDELMEELQREVPSMLEERGNALILRHVYVERKMIPLNLFLREASDLQLEGVMDEYGNAIKQLIGANIFPGDMLLKNFGVTRHGRVIFYDYDEICPLLDCNFRELPQPQTEEQEMASGPWYPVADNDVFPEEFRLFFSGNRRAKEVFDRLHAELYEPGFWQGQQRRIAAGEISDVYPYRRKHRFSSNYRDS